MNGNRILTDKSYNSQNSDSVTIRVQDGDRLLSCIQCGTCTGTCPAAGHMDIVPRQIFRLAQLGMLDELMSCKAFWQCATCASCKVKCPRGIPLSEIMLSLREQYVSGHGPFGNMSMLVSTLETAHNLTGDPPENRILWSENMDQPMTGLDLRHGAEVVYFPGCVSGLFPAVSGIPQSFATLLKAADADFTTLSTAEWCCGFPLFGAGLPGQAREAAVHNVQSIRELGARTLVSGCPSCYHTFAHEYEGLIGEPLGFAVMHSTQYLLSLIEAGRLPLGRVEEVVTYHDPCDLGRKSGIYDPPRRIIRSIPGIELIEMRFVRDHAKCCGGGGNLEMSDKPISEAIAQNRLAEALSTGAKVIISSCQQCKRTLQGAVRRTKSKIKVMDIIELLSRSVEASREEASGT